MRLFAITVATLAAITLAAPAGARPRAPKPHAATANEQPVPTAKTSPGGAENVGQGETFQKDVARRISVDDVKKRMDAGEKVMLVDARAAAHGPVPKGAVHVTSDQLGAWAKDRDKRTFIVTYCA